LFFKKKKLFDDTNFPFEFCGFITGTRPFLPGNTSYLMLNTHVPISREPIE